MTTESMDIQIYTFEQRKIRVLGTHDNPYFVVKDVCDVLELSNVTNALRSIPDKWQKDDFTNCKDISGRSINMLTVNEAGLYKLIMRSTKPVAEKFQEWVCEDILPSIRKKGDYVLQEYKDRIEQKTKEIEQKTKELEEQKIQTEKQQKLLEEQTLQTKKLENKYVKKRI